MPTLALQAEHELLIAFGEGAPCARGRSPARGTIVGEHVDYAGGFVLCAAVDLYAAAAARPSQDGIFRAVSGGRRSERADPAPAGDIGDRVFAAVTALRQAGVGLPAVEVGIASEIPEGAGLASSAAVIAATMDALLGMASRRLPATRFAAAALSAERDVVGVPCGPLDPAAIVFTPDRSALLLDCSTGRHVGIPWPWLDVVLCACDTGERHDVGGAEYRARRHETEAALRRLGVSSCQETDETMIAAASLPEVESRRARHACAESRRAQAAAEFLRAGDAHGLGALMSESHRSLRDLHEVSTPLLDAVVAAAGKVPGCHGARLVGAGFGGSAIALVDAGAAIRCASSMAAAAGRGPEAARVVRPVRGLAALSPNIAGPA